MEESIYNIIPKEYIAPGKPPIYRSKHAPNLPPTGSTFGSHTTSKPKIGNNLSGEIYVGVQAHPDHGKAQTFGHSKENQKSDPHHFLKKQTGPMGNQQLHPPKPFNYDNANKKPSVPKVNEKPVLGQSSGKNFIIANALENILATGKRAPEEIDWKKKKNYGLTPKYLQKMKENIDNEHAVSYRLRAEEEKKNKNTCLSAEEVSMIREGLKRKWAEINKEYQNFTVKVIDTTGMKAKKLNYEKELSQIQSDIKKLNKTYIIVE